MIDRWAIFRSWFRWMFLYHLLLLQITFLCLCSLSHIPLTSVVISPLSTQLVWLFKRYDYRSSLLAFRFRQIDKPLEIIICESFDPTTAASNRFTMQRYLWSIRRNSVCDMPRSSHTSLRSVRVILRNQKSGNRRLECYHWLTGRSSEGFTI